jgi:uncharacterized membrane protein YvlD (DUF360 family)
MDQMVNNRGRRERIKFLVRVLVIWGIEVFGLLIIDWMLSGVEVDGLATSIVAVGVIGLLNALLWPILSYVALPLAVLTLGLASLALNAGLVLLASSVVIGFHVEGFWPAAWLTLGLTAINALLSTLLTIDDDNSWYRNVVRRRMRRRRGGEPVEHQSPGLLFLEIDGLAKPVLEKAIQDGYAPTMAHWLQSGSYCLTEWETDLSSQTSASQAGILQGDNDNIPSFRWWDRVRKKIVSSSNPQEVARLEAEHSHGNGLLVADGASRGNLFSGDAPNVMLTASVATDVSRFHATAFYAFFVDPYNFSRTLLLTIWDILLEVWQFWRDRRNEVRPILDRKKRGGIYPLLRAFTTVVMRELNVHTLIGDMFAGVPSAYATFVGYDEVAHHSGVESEAAFDVLRKLDRQLGRLESAAGQAPRPYHLVLLSDHGQSPGATFKQRYGMALESTVQELATEKFLVRGDTDVHEDWKHLNVFLTETIEHEHKAVSGPLRRLLKKRSRAGNVELGPENQEAVDEAQEAASHIVALASGNLGLIYGSRLDERASLEQIEGVYPGLVAGLAEHEGIGFVVVHSEEDGPVAIGAQGRHYLAEGRVEGQDPLAGFGSNAARHLLRTDSFPDAPDILVNSLYDPQSGEVAAFEELIGSHGGLGGWQTQPFLLYPSELAVPEERIVGAASLHLVLKGWLSSLSTSQHVDPPLR